MESGIDKDSDRLNHILSRLCNDWKSWVHYQKSIKSVKISTSPNPFLVAFGRKLIQLSNNG